ncbi:MAG: DNA integrity scanning protein DisA nucleotide-binding domain protein [Candidatus Izemoplasmatales bacterium]|jgi:diadenylate cyclase|nr:DNA integrity scanning protein DisA nucleotide-binding domain protein [bacterium]MDZ4196049.1 DNA integrity scanning protein DisA nucleotide-binding domain protein [Candidatus Izemoplasmatales bacterium]
MNNISIIVISGYLFAIFLLALRNKVSHKAIRPFKLILVVLILFVFYLWMSEPTTGNQLLTQGILVSILFYITIMMYINEIDVLLKKLGLKGKRRLRSTKTNNDLAQKLSQAIDFLANRKIGALITIEREVKLNGYINKAMSVNAPVSSELLASIFIPTTPLHDGAVIIRDNQILCAKAYYPSTERTDLPLRFGTRHRAAIGISEQSDALTIIVSEETGNVSVTINRQIDYDVSKETLHLYFEKYLKIK